MDNNRFDIQIVTKSVKKYNIYILLVFTILIFLNFLIISTTYNYLVVIWSIIACIALVYDYKHSKSVVLLSTELLFNDNGFSIKINDNNFNLQLKKDDITNIVFNKKNNHILVYQKDKVLCDFYVKHKSLDDLYDIFNSFGYKCELSSYI